MERQGEGRRAKSLSFIAKNQYITNKTDKSRNHNVNRIFRKMPEETTKMLETEHMNRSFRREKASLLCII